MKRGYVGQVKNKEKIYDALLMHGADSFHTDLDDLLNTLKSNDEVIIYDITDLNISMKIFLTGANHLRGKNISIKVINRFALELDTYLDVIETAMEMQQSWLAVRTRNGLERAKEKGHSVGRPKVTDEKIREIKYWYSQKLTLRKISQKTDLSVGTVHNYISSFKEDI